MLSEEVKKRMEKQQYSIIGDHSAVKICGWTKNYIRDEGGCYKYKFYGIASHKCMQMTTSISCANRCIYCWRDYKAPVSKEWKWSVDDPDEIINGSLVAQKKLLIGFWGNNKANKKILGESDHVAHVALSLTGESITYPKFNEIVKKFHSREISTFLVTNAQYPEKIAEIDKITQLYISLDAPSAEKNKKIGVPLFNDSWDRLLASLDIMKEKKYRTAIRMTMIKGMNMDSSDMAGYKDLIIRGDPDFIEIKGYMFIGASRQRLSKENMPYHEEIKEFCSKFVKMLDEYEIVNEQKASRVILLAKKKFKGKTWIDFKKFFEIVKKKEDISSLNYNCDIIEIPDPIREEKDLD